MASTLIVLATAFCIALLAARRFVQPSSVLHILDHPNERSLHTRPTPRTGGLAIVLAMTGAVSAAVFWFDFPRDFVVVAGLALLLAVISFVDDRYSVAVVYRFGAHLLLAAGIVYLGYRVPLPDWLPAANAVVTAGAVVITVLFIAWMINLYNFMDGMDGFAGGMAVFGFSGFAVLGGLSGHLVFALASGVVASATAGFLVLNFPPARIFMGDVGSTVLGFLAAVFSLWGARDGVFPFWVALLMFSPFSVDATFTLLRRALRGERVWEAHRTHLYQRLVQCGWGHRKTVLWEYALMAACVVSGLWGARQAAVVQQALLAGWGALYGALIVAVGFYEQRGRVSPL